MADLKISYRQVKFRTYASKHWHKVFFKLQESPEKKVLAFIDSHGNEDFQSPFTPDNIKRIFNCESWSGKISQFEAKKCREATYEFYRANKFAH